ncbi:MAG TPA: DLW-39 family protein [Marmoricola sp.]|nr:DLW-39 family protein [Marmoricola sp.]
MKKLLLLAAGIAAGVFAKKKMDASRQEQDLWQQATDPVEKA